MQDEYGNKASYLIQGKCLYSIPSGSYYDYEVYSETFTSTGIHKQMSPEDAEKFAFNNKLKRCSYQHMNGIARGLFN